MSETSMNRVPSDDDLTPRATSCNSFPSLGYFDSFRDHTGISSSSSVPSLDCATMDSMISFDDDDTPPATPISQSQFDSYPNKSSVESMVPAMNIASSSLPNTDPSSFETLGELQRYLEDNDDGEILTSTEYTTNNEPSVTSSISLESSIRSDRSFVDAFTADRENVEAHSDDSFFTTLDAMLRSHGCDIPMASSMVDESEDRWTARESFDTLPSGSSTEHITSLNNEVRDVTPAKIRVPKLNLNHRSRYVLPKRLEIIEEEPSTPVDLGLDLALSMYPGPPEPISAEESAKMDAIFMALDISESLRETAGQDGPDPKVVALMSSSNPLATENFPAFMDSLTMGICAANEEAIRLLATPRASSKSMFPHTSTDMSEWISMSGPSDGFVDNLTMAPTAFQYMAVPASQPSSTPRRVTKAKKNGKKSRKQQVVVGDIVGLR